MAEYSEIMLGFVRAHKEWAGPIVLLLAFGEVAGLHLPHPAVLDHSGRASARSSAPATALNYWTVLSCAAIGAALGDWLSYWLGYHYHERIGSMWPLSRYPNLLPKGHAFFEKWGVWAIVIGRFSGPLRASVPIVAGVTQMPQIKFQIANWSSAFLWAFVLLSPGTYGMKWWLNHFS